MKKRCMYTIKHLTYQNIDEKNFVGFQSNHNINQPWISLLNWNENKFDFLHEIVILIIHGIYEKNERAPFCWMSRKWKKQFLLGISCCPSTYNESKFYFYFYLAQLNKGTDNFHIHLFGKTQNDNISKVCRSLAK